MTLPRFNSRALVVATGRPETVLENERRYRASVDRALKNGDIALAQIDAFIAATRATLDTLNIDSGELGDAIEVLEYGLVAANLEISELQDDILELQEDASDLAVAVGVIQGEVAGLGTWAFAPATVSWVGGDPLTPLVTFTIPAPLENSTVRIGFDLHMENMLGSEEDLMIESDGTTGVSAFDLRPVAPVNGGEGTISTAVIADFTSGSATIEMAAGQQDMDLRTAISRVYVTKLR